VFTTPDFGARLTRVWLLRGPQPTEPTDWIDVTGEATAQQGGGYRIAFRDISGDETFRSWLKGDEQNAPARMILHRHDNGFGIDAPADQAASSQIALACGVPGSSIYAVRLGRSSR
jgi:hypothetical protein